MPGPSCVCMQVTSQADVWSFRVTLFEYMKQCTLHDAMDISLEQVRRG